MVEGRVEIRKGRRKGLIKRRMIEGRKKLGKRRKGEERREERVKGKGEGMEE